MSEYYKKAIRWKQHVQILIMLLSSCWSETVGQRSNTSTRCVSVVFKLVSGTICFITFSLERSECRPPHSGTDGWSAGQQTQVSSKAQSEKQPEEELLSARVPEPPGGTWWGVGRDAAVLWLEPLKKKKKKKKVNSEC